MFRKTEEAIPSIDQNHVVAKILSLNLQFLHNYDISLEDIEHGWKGATVAPWLISKRISNSVDVPCRNSNSTIRAHVIGLYVSMRLVISRGAPKTHQPRPFA